MLFSVIWIFFLFFFPLQCVDTIEKAFSYVDQVNPLIFLHSGIYQGEYLAIESNISVIGAGK